MKKKTTIQEVAKKSGYSPSTIARSISNPSIVSSKTRFKIDKIIKKTGYVHNYLASRLKSGKSGFVIAIIPTLRLSVFADYIYGIKEKLRENGFELLIGLTNYNIKTEEELVTKFLSYKPEGFIVVGTQHTETTTRLLLNSKSPIVETWNITDRPLDIVVGFSNFSAGLQITDYMISLNYKNIAFATPANKHMGSENRSKRRLSGYLSRMKIAKLKTTIFYFTEPSNHKLSGKQIFNQFKEHNSKIDCIICGNEASGAGLISECNDRNFPIPKKLGIATFGSSDITLLLHPQLTTIDFKAEEMGAKAANNLISKIKNQKIKKIHDVGFELIKGASVENQKAK